MSASRRSALVIGAGVFGAAAALELDRRGFVTELVAPAPLPDPAAASNDVSKAVRMDYGSDDFYVDLAARALDGWRDWNRRFDAAPFHEVGILLLAGATLTPASFEGACWDELRARGVPLERLDADRLAQRFPAWRQAAYPDGYYNPAAGWVDSAQALMQLLEQLRATPVRIHDGSVRRLLERGSRVAGVVLEDGTERTADVTLVAAGAWTPALLPHLAPWLWATAQPVVHFAPADPRPYAGSVFPVWCADIARTGWYGFPVTADGSLKIGHHGPGRPWRPGEPLAVDAATVERFREFAGTTFPGLDEAPVRKTRLCLYCDSFDGDFWIDHDPDRPGLVVAAGDSGHAFKFAPLLGSLIADVVERRAEPALARRFGWRRSDQRRTEQARHT